MGISAGLGTAGLQPAVCTSTTRPAAPYAGQMIFETDTNRVVIYKSSSWVYIADADTPPSLELIATKDASSNAIQIDNCFSSTYRSYRIIGNLRGSNGGGVTVWMKLVKSGTASSAGYYTLSNYNTASGGPTRDYSTNASTGWWAGVVADVASDSFSLDIYEPFVSTVKTSITGSLVSFGSSQAWQAVTGGFHNTADSYDGVYLYPNSGNMTGSIAVYGYRN
jgi:hypothetical protein